MAVQLVSRGRRDIAREAFDEGRPVCLDLSTPIVQCVKVTTSPSDRPDPSYALNGSKLLIGPSHFGKRQTTVFSLLLDGKTPEIVKPQQSLIDVEIRQGDGQTLFTSPTRWVFLSVVALAAAVAAAFASIFTSSNSGAAVATAGVATAALAVVVVPLIVWVSVGDSWRRRRD